MLPVLGPEEDSKRHPRLVVSREKRRLGMQNGTIKGIQSWTECTLDSPQNGLGTDNAFSVIVNVDIRRFKLYYDTVYRTR